MAGIYIHIPFCRRKCEYCDFYSCTELDRREEFLATVARELGSERGFIGETAVDSIYIGGGTPTVCSPVQLQSLIDRVRSLWFCSGMIEITVEANPDDLSSEYIAQLAETDVNRVSLGVQSFINRDLYFMNRRHTSKQAVDAVRELRRHGFHNISVDLIFGIPGMNEEEWRFNLDSVLELSVQHISVYHLTVEEGTPLAGKMAAGRFTPVGEMESEGQYLTAHRMLSGAGYEHYEISNYSLPGFRAVHNSSYWTGQPYLGVGPSAHSYNGRQRRWSERSLDKYLELHPHGNIYRSETLKTSEIYNEFIMTALRTSEGVDINRLRQRFGQEREHAFISVAAGYISSGHMATDGLRYYIPCEKMLVSDAVISGFFI